MKKIRILVDEYLVGKEVTCAVLGNENPKVLPVLEINTIPGLTPMSLFPKAAKAAGISYGQLLDKIIEYAIKN